jgi:hemoglobin/transferrin/lactoferrin receptor protein
MIVIGSQGSAPERRLAGGVYAGYAQLHVPPEKSGSLTMGVRLLDEKLTIGGRMTDIGARSPEAMAVPGGFTYVFNRTSYTMYTCSASYKRSDNFQFDLAVDNITDVYYMDALTLGLMPSPGHAARAGLTLTGKIPGFNPASSSLAGRSISVGATVARDSDEATK